MSELLTYGLVVVFLVAVVASALSTGYMGQIYGRSQRPRSWFFRMMLNSAILKVLCGGYLGYSTGTFLLVPLGIRLPRVPTEINGPLLLIIAIILISPPIYYAWTIRQVRRAGVYDPEVALAERTTDNPVETAARIDGGNDVMPPREADHESAASE